MICVLVGAADGDPGSRALREGAAALGYETAEAADLDRLRADPRLAAAPRALVLVLDPADPEAVIRFAAAAEPGTFVVLVGDALAPDAYKRLVRTGRGEWFARATAAEELRELALRLAAQGAAPAGGQPGDAPERAARVVAFLPSRGGVGTTTLALEAGVHLAGRRGGGRVAVLDLNVQGGTLADALDLEPRLDLAELIERPERLDEHLIDVFTSRHSPRLDVFAGPVRALAPEALPAPTVFALIDAVARRYGTLLLDLPPYWLPWTDNLVQGSDAVVAVGGATVPGLRHLAARLAHLDGLGVGGARVAAAVNGCDADLLGRPRRAREIARALPGRQLFLVRRDAAAACGALDAGRSLLEQAPTSRVARDIKRLAAWTAGPAAGGA